MRHSSIIDIDAILLIAKKKGLTQAQLCEKAGLHRCIISRIRNKKCTPRLSNIRKLIEAATDD